MQELKGQHVKYFDIEKLLTIKGQYIKYILKGVE